MYTPGTVVRIRSNCRDYMVPPLTAGIVQEINNERGSYNTYVKWDRRIGNSPHMTTWVEERGIEPLPDPP